MNRGRTLPEFFANRADIDANEQTFPPSLSVSPDMLFSPIASGPLTP